MSVKITHKRYQHQQKWQPEHTINNFTITPIGTPLSCLKCVQTNHELRVRLANQLPQKTPSPLSVERKPKTTQRRILAVEECWTIGHQKHTIADMHWLFRLEQIVEGETYKHFQTWWYWADRRWEVEAEVYVDEDPPNLSSQDGMTPFSLWLGFISPHSTLP